MHERGVKCSTRPSSLRCRRMWEEDVESAARRKVAWLIGIVVAAVIALAGWYWYASRQRPAPATPVVAPAAPPPASQARSEEHTSELQSLTNLVCRLLLEKKKQL